MKYILRGFGYFVSFLIFGSLPETALAISVNRIVLAPRHPDAYVRNVRTALNTQTGQTLVIWESHPGRGDHHSVWGQLLGPDGKPVGRSFKIISSSLNPFAPGVIYNPDTNQFVLVYGKTKPGVFSEIYAVRLRATGRPKGKAVRVSHPSNPTDRIFNDRPVVSYDSANKATIIIWTRYGEGTPNPADPAGIYGAILDSKLSIRHKPVLLQSLHQLGDVLFGPHISDTAIHAPSGKLILGQVLFTPVTFQSEYSLAQVDSTFRNPIATINKLDTKLSESGGGVDLMILPSGQMAALFSQDDGVRKRKISSGAAPSGPAGKFFAEPVRSVPLKVSGSAFAISGTAKQIAVLGFTSSESEDAHFWLQLANVKGKATGSPIEIESGVDSVRGGTISALPAESKSGHLYAVLYVEGERDAPPLVNQGSGLVLLRVNTAP